MQLEPPPIPPTRGYSRTGGHIQGYSRTGGRIRDFVLNNNNFMGLCRKLYLSLKLPRRNFGARNMASPFPPARNLGAKSIASHFLPGRSFSANSIAGGFLIVCSGYRMHQKVNTKAFILENVEGITTLKNGEYLQTIMEELRSIPSYTMCTIVINIRDRVGIQKQVQIDTFHFPESMSMVPTDSLLN